MVTVITTLKDRVYRTILQRIIGLEYLPGQKISENELSKELQVGRTPIRESILQLRQEGLINSIPQSGTYISKINLPMAKDARFMRESVEVRIIKETIRKLNPYDYMWLSQVIERQNLIGTSKNNKTEFFKEDESFHHYFYTITGHEQVWTWLQSVNMHLNRFRFLRLQNKNLSWGPLVNEHQDLLDAIESKNESRAIELISVHLHRMLDEEPELRNMFPDYFEDGK